MSVLWTSLLVSGEVVAYLAMGALVARLIASRRWKALADWVGDVADSKRALLGLVFCWWVILGTYSITRMAGKLASRRHGAVPNDHKDWAGHPGP